MLIINKLQFFIENIPSCNYWKFMVFGHNSSGKEQVVIPLAMLLNDTFLIHLLFNFEV